MRVLSLNAHYARSGHHRRRRHPLTALPILFYIRDVGLKNIARKPLHIYNIVYNT